MPPATLRPVHIVQRGQAEPEQNVPLNQVKRDVSGQQIDVEVGPLGGIGIAAGLQKKKRR